MKLRLLHIIRVTVVNLFICVIFGLYGTLNVVFNFLTFINLQELYDRQICTYSLYQTVFGLSLHLVLLASRRLQFGTFYLLLLKPLTHLTFQALTKMSFV